MKLSDIENLFQGYANYIKSPRLPVHIKEQIQLRAFLCQPCLMNGKCLVCNCKTPVMFYAPNKVDSKDLWSTFMSEHQWNSLKKNLHLYVDFFKQLKDESS